MYTYTLLTFLLACSLSAVLVNGSPLPVASPKDAGDYQGSTDTKDIVKRRIYEENADSELKQVALSSLIEQLEDSLFRSAVSVSDVVQDDAKAKSSAHDAKVLRKRHVESSSAAPTTTTTTTATTTSTNTPTPITFEVAPDHETSASNDDRVLVQTTAKVPEKDGIPAHILIDRVSVHPHFGGLPIVPAFQIHQTKLTTIKEVDANSSKISITKTAIQAVGGTAAETTKEEVSTAATSTTADLDSTTKSADAAPSSTTPTTDAAVTKDAKEAEHELKEKVAEIEAEPVILSARV